MITTPVPEAGWTLGTDVGGTFTDLWLRSPAGESWVCKSPTTPDIVTGVVNAVHLAAASVGLSTRELCGQVTRFGHGTTVGLNALLTGRTGRTGLITTRGFGDVLEIGRLRRGTAGLQGLELGDYALRGRTAPLVPRALVVEVDERVDAWGKVRTPPRRRLGPNRRREPARSGGGGGRGLPVVGNREPGARTGRRQPRR
ncbi:hydantoinase/oxoprolinase N-terminal domain-containing protein [Streptomyces sp. NPDC101455]|uniref:hydantoinase/oxoprolinase N-terminal domain-containing protein n=1 Tax=Streptomyces sp. NPDC101455 TaxID=3366142 RepID=UPI0038244F79